MRLRQYPRAVIKPVKKTIVPSFLRLHNSGLMERCCLLVFTIALIFTGFTVSFNPEKKAIETLVVTVRPGDMVRYLVVDAEIWTSFLQQQPGFISKQNLLATDAEIETATEVYQIIEWNSYQQWKNISSSDLARVNERFVQAFGYAPTLRALPNPSGFQVVGIPIFK